ncbi:unnamed protein product [Protopolystoma xenopodis]|uniref:Uncharacterized protein n=1 Tax=Protopolystoma xenopodis TaxID=117903 RepID=A0A448XMX0_9PLAT|nr:unnamed protein product [Protopolystoma xenopodis]
MRKPYGRRSNAKFNVIVGPYSEEIVEDLAIGSASTDDRCSLKTVLSLRVVSRVRSQRNTTAGNRKEVSTQDCERPSRSRLRRELVG